MNNSSAFARKGGFLAAVVGAAVCFVEPASAGAEVAKSTPTFLNSLGINAHVSLAQGPYSDVFALTGKLNYLGITHVRDDVRNTTASLARYQTLGSTGTKLTLMLSPKAVPDVDGALGALAPLAPFIDTLEGANEINVTPPVYGGYTGVPAAQAYQRKLWSSSKANPSFATSSTLAQFTYGPVVVNPEGAGIADVGNVHLYPLLKQPPFYTIAMAAKTLGVPAHKYYLTEYNYATSTDANKGVSETVQAKYLLDGMFDATKIGFPRTYIYEVMDEGTLLSNPEFNFGLFHYDGTAKIAATAIHNLTQILGTGVTNPPQSFAPGALTYSISQKLTLAFMDANLYHLLLQGPNGTFYLVLWAEPPLYSGTTAIAPPAPHPATIIFPSVHSDVQVFDPLVGTTAISDYPSTNSVTVSTTDHPIILAISNN